MKTSVKYGILLLALLITGLFLYGLLFHSGGKPKVLEADPIYISACQLVTTFEGNESLSDSLYLYKILSVRGVLQKVLKNEMGHYVAVLGTPKPGRQTAIDCTLDSLYNQRYLSLRPGDSVTIRGTCAGRLNNVLLLQCIIEN